MLPSVVWERGESARGQTFGDGNRSRISSDESSTDEGDTAVSMSLEHDDGSSSSGESSGDTDRTAASVSLEHDTAALDISNNRRLTLISDGTVDNAASDSSYDARSDAMSDISNHDSDDVTNSHSDTSTSAAALRSPESDDDYYTNRYICSLQIIERSVLKTLVHLRLRATSEGWTC